jgi:hypothetical protein
VDEAEVVNPGRRRASGLHLVRTLVYDLDTHVFEQRQYLRERDLLSQPEQLEPQEILGSSSGW